LTQKFKGINHAALDLVDKMLVFNPAERITGIISAMGSRVLKSLRLKIFVTIVPREKYLLS